MSNQSTINPMILNSPYEEPSEYWSYRRDGQGFQRMEGRRPAGYMISSENSQSFDDPGIRIDIPLVNTIRPRVRAWRNDGYYGVTSITKSLLEYWNNQKALNTQRFFFCQLDAAETLIWLKEAPSYHKFDITIPPNGGEFERLCTKMATGSGKTIVMAMVIAWHILNKVTYPRDTRFSKNILVIAPGLTVKDRLSVLKPENAEYYYNDFPIVPPSLREKLQQGNVIIHNWHTLNWETEEQIAKKYSVDKRGPKSDRAYARDVLGKMAKAHNILVINDEAHHAWRVPPDSKLKGIDKEEVEQATKWVGGLDRIHNVCNILTCYDFSATPFAPSSKGIFKEALFGWIVSDFSLNDALEAGLTKTPRVVVRDDTLPDPKTYRSRLYHIYNDPEVKDDLNRKAEPHEPLPDLVLNGYHCLGVDWRETQRAWHSKGLKTPPVMISVANRTETAARVMYAFKHNKIKIDELCDETRILHIDSKVLAQAESAVISSAETEENHSKAKRNEDLRQKVNTVGQIDQPGEQSQNVISVGMLSEGWNTKTVTHIMGLRAFTSQLLCEQIVGRGLRRTSYELNSQGLFEAEYVNVFGIPFTFLPHETEKEGLSEVPKPTTLIQPEAAKVKFKIEWPNVIRIEDVYRPKLSLDQEKLVPLKLDASETQKLADMARVVDGKPDFTQIKTIELEQLAHDFRTQRIIFETARDVYDQMQTNWKGHKAFLLAQLVRLIELFIRSDKIIIAPVVDNQDALMRRLIITLNMTKIVHHIWDAIRFKNVKTQELVFDKYHPIGSTHSLRHWYTRKPCHFTKHSHINFCIYDSTWEASAAYELDRNPKIHAWVKNDDHLGFEIRYIYQGVVRKYFPDFLIRLTSGLMVVLEIKGQDSDKSQTKQRFLDEWVKGVNQDGRFGRWSWDISTSPSQIKDIIEQQFQTGGIPQSTLSSQCDMTSDDE